VKLLLIDDDTFALTLMEHQLAVLGFADVRSFTQAGEALSACGPDGRGADVVICDLQMPDMDGVELVRHLGRAGFEGGVVLVSGEDEHILKSVSSLARAHRLNVLGALRKPVSSAQLGELLARCETAPAARGREADRAYGADELHDAIVADQFVNYYQPKVDIASGRVIGAEALARWRHPQDGIVSPARFIDTIEANGLADDLTRRLLPAALRQARRWHDGGLALSVAVNVSMDSLCRLDFPDWVSNVAEHADIGLPGLVLEVTESRLMTNPLVALDVLTRLRLKHVSLSIDDFGTGYSSLAQLRDIPFTELKIDRSFVHGACHDAALQAIVEASLGVARQLGMDIVAEGVEDLADWDWLCRSCQGAAQGYFVARPMPAAEFEGWATLWPMRIGAMRGGQP
jgi:EAL domain-containing protein (putative c-di-GMP-specific phosphodiesterase class I)/FixJ family two-component response regulator